MSSVVISAGKSDSPIIVVVMSANNMSASDLNSDNPEPAKSRFYEAREGEVELIREGRYEVNTKKGITFGPLQ